LKEEISTLIALQKFDTELSNFDQDIEDKKKELTDREQSIVDKEAIISACREKVEELSQRQRDIKAAHEDAATRIKERQNKMMQVQTSREHQALLKEIEDAKKLIKDTEEQLLQVMEQAEAEEEKAVELEHVCKGEKELLSEETDKVEAAVKKLNTRRKTVFNKRNKLAKEVSGSRMKRYEKLLKKRKGLAVVQIRDAVCQGCFMTVPPQQYNEIRQGDHIFSCPNCQRTLYYLPPDQDAD
jgi:predicted  nucleic acid-binding Zn-ribbon protein